MSKKFKTVFALSREEGEHLAVIGLTIETSIVSIEPLKCLELLGKVVQVLKDDSGYEELKINSATFQRQSYTWDLEVIELEGGKDVGDFVVTLSSSAIY